MDNLIKLFAIAVATISQACDQNETDTTELEGTWSSICSSVVDFSFFDTAIDIPPQKIITTYNGSNVSIQGEIYSDPDCTILESTLDADNNTSFSDPGSTPVTFSIGQQVTSANGVTVREIDYYSENNEVLPNIYLLQDNGSTLYFGIPCVGTTTTCNNNRPTEIMYDFPYTKK